MNTRLFEIREYNFLNSLVWNLILNNENSATLEKAMVEFFLISFFRMRFPKNLKSIK